MPSFHVKVTLMGEMRTGLNKWAMGNVYICCGVHLYCTQTWMSSNALCQCKMSSFLMSLKTGLPVNNQSLRLQKTGSNNFRICSCCHIINYDFKYYGEVADEKTDVC